MDGQAQARSGVDGVTLGVFLATGLVWLVALSVYFEVTLDGYQLSHLVLPVLLVFVGGSLAAASRRVPTFSVVLGTVLVALAYFTWLVTGIEAPPLLLGGMATGIVVLPWILTAYAVLAIVTVYRRRQP